MGAGGVNRVDGHDWSHAFRLSVGNTELRAVVDNGRFGQLVNST